MATISIQGSTIGYGFGFGCFSELAVSFESARDSAGNLVSALGQLKEKIDLADVETNVESTYTDVSESKLREETKSGALSNVYKKLEEFITDIGSVDAKAANRIEDRKDDFYERYYYLKPECEKTTREHIKDCLQNCSDFIGSAVEFIGKAVGEWIAEHWEELVAGLVLIVIGAVITVFTGGTFLAAIVQGLVAAAISASVSGIVKGGITFYQYKKAGFSTKTALKNALNSFGDGLAEGFLSGSIGFAVGAGVGGLGNMFIGKTDLLVGHSAIGSFGRGFAYGASTNITSTILSKPVEYVVAKILGKSDSEANSKLDITMGELIISGISGGISGGLESKKLYLQQNAKDDAFNFENLQKTANKEQGNFNQSDNYISYMEERLDKTYVQKEFIKKVSVKDEIFNKSSDISFAGVDKNGKIVSIIGAKSSATAKYTYNQKLYGYENGYLSADVITTGSKIKIQTILEGTELTTIRPCNFTEEIGVRLNQAFAFDPKNYNIGKSFFESFSNEVLKNIPNNNKS